MLRPQRPKKEEQNDSKVIRRKKGNKKEKQMKLKTENEIRSMKQIPGSLKCQQNCHSRQFFRKLKRNKRRNKCKLVIVGMRQSLQNVQTSKR